MDSPLSEVITLTVNDCCYSGPELTPICQDISPHFLYPLRLVSRKGWKEAMAGDEAPQYWEAAKTEIATLEAMEAWDVVSVASVPSPSTRSARSISMRLTMYHTLTIGTREDIKSGYFLTHKLKKTIYLSVTLPCPSTNATPRPTSSTAVQIPPDDVKSTS